MEKPPYHHIYKDGFLYAFKNPKNGPQRDPNFKWKWKIFSEEKKKLKIDYPPEHVVNKQEVLKNLQKHQSDSFIMWLGHASFILKLGNTTVITDAVFESNYMRLVGLRNAERARSAKFARKIAAFSTPNS